MNASDFGGYIFDVDGTLYSQKKVRRAMLFRILLYYAFRPFHWRELCALFIFRRFREKRELCGQSMGEICQKVSQMLKMSKSVVDWTIRFWMFEEPLDLLYKYRYCDVLEFIKKEHSAGKKIIIYSDYPAVEKLAVMQIPYDHLFVSGENGIKELKPSAEAMCKILAVSGLTADRLVYIGDRDERDKASAELAHIAYCDIRAFRKLKCSCRLNDRQVADLHLNENK